MNDLERDLVREYGTPLYIYRLDRVRQAAADLRAALPAEARLYYSVKANPHPAIARTLHEVGLHLEISSAGELATAPASGHGADGCLYTGPGKTSQEIKGAIRAGVRTFSVESKTDRDRVADAARRSNCEVDYIVRLNGHSVAHGGLRMTSKPSQFGVDTDNVDDLKALFQPDTHARPVGVHIFAATGIADPGALTAELASSIRTARETLDVFGDPPLLVDLGGGFATPFARPGRRPEYPLLRETLERELDWHFAGWRGGEPRVAFESGRYLTGDCGTLLTTVVDVKESRGTTYAVLDAGIQTLGGMWGLGRLLAPDAQPEPGTSAEPGAVTLVGPLCTPLDVLSRSARTGVPLVGDVLAIPNVGAYGLAASLVGFLSRPIAAEAVVDDGTVIDVRRLEIRPGEAL